MTVNRKITSAQISIIDIANPNQSLEDKQAIRQKIS